MNRFFSTLLLCVATVLCVAGANPSAGGLPCLWHFDKARHAAHAATFVDEGYLTADGRPGATLRYLRADGNAPGGFVRTLGKSHNPAVRGGAAGDCWLFAVPVDSLGRGERIGIDFLFGNDASAPKYYRLEYFERGRWLPAAQLRRAAEDPDIRYTHRLFASGKGNSYKVFGSIRLHDALVRDTLRIYLRVICTARVSIFMAVLHGVLIGAVSLLLGWDYSALTIPLCALLIAALGYLCNRFLVFRGLRYGCGPRTFIITAIRTSMRFTFCSLLNMIPGMPLLPAWLISCVLTVPVEYAFLRLLALWYEYRASRHS